jgi:hypothetical protein
MFTLILKELRSTAWVVALGAAAFGWFLSELFGVSTLLRGSFPRHPNIFPFVHAGWLMWFGLISASFAGGLGLVMSLNDGLRGTWQFVLFRPFSRRAYVAAKLLAGGVLTVVMVAVPAMIFLVWGAIPGHLLLPFDWSYAQPAAEACGWAVVIFLGGFLSGIRPASWWWSRLWPLGATVVLGLWWWMVSFVEEQFPAEFTPTVPQYWGLCVIVSAMLVASILHVVDERDFA